MSPSTVFFASGSVAAALFLALAAPLAPPARAVRPGPNRLRLEFPSPQVESRFDILELERRK